MKRLNLDKDKKITLTGRFQLPYKSTARDIKFWSCKFLANLNETSHTLLENNTKYILGSFPFCLVNKQKVL